MMDLQRAIYEATDFLGPHASAILAGFAVVIFGEVYRTPAGERYLDIIDQESEP